MSDSELYGDGQMGNTQVDFSFLEFNTQTDNAFNDLPQTADHDQVYGDIRNVNVKIQRCF
jgi:hypothetical protein